MKRNKNLLTNIHVLPKICSILLTLYYITASQTSTSLLLSRVHILHVCLYTEVEKALHIHNFLHFFESHTCLKQKIAKTGIAEYKISHFWRPTLQALFVKYSRLYICTHRNKEAFKLPANVCCFEASLNSGGIWNCLAS